MRSFAPLFAHATMMTWKRRLKSKDVDENLLGWEGIVAHMGLDDVLAPLSIFDIMKKPPPLQDKISVKSNIAETRWMSFENNLGHFQQLHIEFDVTSLGSIEVGIQASGIRYQIWE